MTGSPLLSLTDVDLDSLADLVVSPRRLLDALGGERLTVRLGDHRLAVSSNDHAQLDYLQTLFVPSTRLWAVEASPGPPPVRAAVGLRVSEDRLRALVGALEARSRARTSVRMHVNAPAVQHSMADGVKWTCAEGTNSVDGPVLVVHSDKGLVCLSTDHAYGYLDFARQLREYGYRRAEDDAWVGFHASCAELPGGGGALIVGRSTAGKSTLALSLAMARGGGFVANDRVVVRVGSGPDPRLTGIGMPVPIRVNGGTVKALGLEEAVGWTLLRPQPDYRNSDWDRFGGQSKLNVLPAEWRDRTRTRLVDEVDLRVVILPRARPTRAGLRIVPADPAEVADVVTEQCMAPDDEVFVEDWLRLRQTTADELRRNAVRTVRHVTRLPVLSVEFGPGTSLPRLGAELAETARSVW